MAGYRPTDWHVLDLEKDPTPGDPVRVKSLAKNLHDFADDVQDALRLVKGMADEDAVLTMVGKTADVFRDEFSGVPKNLKKLKKSYDLAGDALAAYWPSWNAPRPSPTRRWPRAGRRRRTSPPPSPVSPRPIRG